MIAVLDASAFAPVIIPDEREQLLPGLQESLEGDELIVPRHWYLEVANMLLMALRRGRIGPTDQEHAMRTLRSVNVEVDEDASAQSLPETWSLAERHQLTIYDAAYLELAKRSGLALATSDRALANAAGRESVQLFGQ